MENLILDTDSYKASHYLQYPEGTSSMFSYLESRGGEYSGTIFFGLQYLLKKYLTQRVTAEMVREASEFFGSHGEPFPYNGWMYIVNKLGGKLPIRIRAVPEGMYIPNQNVLMTVESTDPTVFWVVGWLETMLVRLWYPITVATRSHHIRKNIYKYLVKSSDEPEIEIDYKLHDFGSRGVSSRESSEIGGMAHLINFYGSDNVPGVSALGKYYNNDIISGFSIPAAEHSTITAWGKEHEVDAYRNMLNMFAKPNSLVAVVSDSYDLWNAIDTLWCGELKQQVIDSGATVIIRPDSGRPVDVVLATLARLEKGFGSTENSKGYTVLNHVRVIQGDGITDETISEILHWVNTTGYSASNINFGMGGGLLQQLNRDTQRFAFKCSSVTVNGIPRSVFKDPVTDSRKRSKSGRLDLVRWPNGKLRTMVLPEDGTRANSKTVMNTVFENGEILLDQNLYGIRELNSI